MRRARTGDDLAFEEIVRRYRAPLIRYSARHVGRDNAEDITQHALASAAAHLRDDPRPIHLRAWLYRVAHNAAINMRTRKDWSHEELSPDIDGVPQPPELAAQRSEVRQVVSDLDRLPERQRTALLLSVFEGLGYEEIAARLDTSPNSVRALLSRARVHLRRAAAAIAPLPLLQSLIRKISGLASATGGSQGTIVAGGSVIQAKLVAVAATTLVAGAATVERVSHNDAPVTAGPPAAALVSAPVVSERVVPLDNPTALLPHVAKPPPAKSEPAPPVSEAPAPVAEEPVAPTEPVAEVPPVDPAPVVEEVPLESSPPPPADETPKEEEEFETEPSPPGNDPPPADGNPPPDGYTPAPPDGYTPAP